ncbi:hypothetical protein [Brevibacillus choshinensis]|uniref:Uncharacterized protein n=1 Tax=Brevibacillus choshinensis TaxID=54911 RepID=A0ABX7FK15_BRECH|nr:hypothetical protein [Brevibacillus choshinensis]QRG66467.1 hypothetical protein JNE38_23520 [Brevibacillus choshinensis]
MGEPRLVICLYGPEPLHVDLKFITVRELETRVENPLVLWERGRRITETIESTVPVYPSIDPQWTEDRFWIWVHYGAAKLGRGELYEVIDTITFLRRSVIGPCILHLKGRHPNGVRRLEEFSSEFADALKETVPSHSANNCYHALKTTITLYRDLRDRISRIKRKADAEEAAVAYLDKVYSSLSR